MLPMFKIMELQVIAHARNGFSQKFGIPRQSREDSCIETHIIFTPAYRVREALRGIEEYSHLWLLWGFNEVIRRKGEAARGDEVEWTPTVRPPRLGGNKRMGVFATRSPFRPNPIGLTSVKLLRVEETQDEGLVLVVSGADLLDGTPIYDIKPYLTFSDSPPAGRSPYQGTAGQACVRSLEASHCSYAESWSKQVKTSCRLCFLGRMLCCSMGPLR